MRLTTEKFIEKANKKHNHKYDYSNTVYTGCFEKVKIICNKHGEFEQRPSKHLYGQGCPLCCKNIKSNTGEFITRSKLKHNNRYDYSMVTYEKNTVKVPIICNLHGIFYQNPANHLNGDGCPFCFTGAKPRLTTSEFIEKAKKIHGDKYDYSKVEYEKSHIKVIITCKEHGDFEQEPNNHLAKQGCPKCASIKNISENKLFDIINDNFKNFNVVQSYRCDWLGKKHIDIFIQDYNIGIEYQGKQHFKPVDAFGGEKAFKQNKLADISKHKQCIQNNIDLLYFSYCKNIDFTNYIDKVYVNEDELFDKINELINIKKAA